MNNSATTLTIFNILYWETTNSHAWLTSLHAYPPGIYLDPTNFQNKLLSLNKALSLDDRQAIQVLEVYDIQVSDKDWLTTVVPAETTTIPTNIMADKVVESKTLRKRASDLNRKILIEKIPMDKISTFQQISLCMLEKATVQMAFSYSM